MRSRLLLVLWLIAILFPMAFLGMLWPAFGRLFNIVFTDGWTHIVMHSFLYAILGILLAAWFKPTSIRPAMIILGLGLLVGVCHEGLQILGVGHWPGWPAEILDIGVDLAGTTIGLTLAWVCQKWRSVARLPRKIRDSHS